MARMQCLKCGKDYGEDIYEGISSGYCSPDCAVQGMRDWGVDESDPKFADIVRRIKSGFYHSDIPARTTADKIITEVKDDLLHHTKRTI